MKKFILAAIMLLALSMNNSSAYAQSYTQKGTTFVQIPKSGRPSKPAIKTKYTWKDSKGKEYPIYLSGNGKAYVVKVSGKTGKEYKQYMDKGISEKLAKEYNINTSK